MKRAFWGWVVGLLLVTAGCSGKSRPFGEGAPLGADPADVESLTPGEQIPGAPGSTAAAGEGNPTDPALMTSGAGAGGLAPGPLGAVCAVSADCAAPAACVDGVCCSSACTDLCAACNAPGSVGTCSAAPSDVACGSLTCPGVDTECRKLDQTQLSLNCEAFGSCKPQADCAALPAPAGTPCQLGTGSCDGSGACIVAGKATLGATCADDTSCAEGHCIAAAAGGPAICCDAACDDPCETCSAAGHCELTPTSDPRCDAVACPPDDVCRDYTADVTASECRAFGQCQTGLDCAFVALRPEAECVCDPATGACRLQPGAVCASAGECASGVCIANGQGTNVCCENACGEGLFCSSNGAACVECEGTGIQCEGNVASACEAGVVARTVCPNGCTPGVGCNALPPLGFLCDAGQCAPPNICQPDTTAQQRCCARDCAAEGKVCAENGSCACQAGQVQTGNQCLLQAGDPCQTSAQCQAGASCTDGVCCQEACSGSCERCEPNTGLCVAVAAGQPDPQCSNGRQCTGARSDCRLTVRQPCSGNGAECTTNNCEPTVGSAAQICCSQACTADRPFCRSDGSSCVQCETNADCGNGCNTATGLCNGLLAIGSPCGATPQCASGGQCLVDQDGQTRCCEANCGALGQVCDARGQCVARAPAVLVTVGGAPDPFPRTLVGASANVSRQLTVQNAGDSATGAISIAVDLPQDFTTTGTCFNAVLQPGASCSVTVSFSPTAPGNRASRVVFQAGVGVSLVLNVSGDARNANGQTCNPNRVTDCDSNTCTRWLVDADEDGFGAFESVNGFPELLLCGDASAGNRPAPFVFVGGCRGADTELAYVADQGRSDCCDRLVRCDLSGGTTVSAASAFPGQTQGSSGILNCGTAPNAGLSHDFNCDGNEGLVAATVDPPLSCELGTAADCSTHSGRLTDPDCSNPTSLIYTSRGCTFSGGACIPNGAGQKTALCL
jgi:hypothetical protein